MNNSHQMYDLPREQLKYIVTEYGRSIGEDSKRCEGLLRDLCGQHPKEINTIVAAIRERVPADLLSSQGHIPPEVLIGQLVKRLEDRLGLTREVAQWTVESWALALGTIQVASDPSNLVAKISEDDTWIDPDSPSITNLISNRSNPIADSLISAQDPVFLLKIAQANYKIRNNWITGITSGSIVLLMAIFYPASSSLLFFIALLTFGFAFGLYKKNIFSIVTMPIFSLLSQTVVLGITMNPFIFIQFIICLYFFVEGIRGILSYRKLLKNNSSSQ